MDFQRIVPWILLSGFIFFVLSYAANRYHGKERTRTQLTQDFVGGSIFMGLLSAVVPDIFPDLSGYVPSSLANIKISDATKLLEKGLSSPLKGMSGGAAAAASTDDIELQVGPLP